MLSPRSYWCLYSCWILSIFIAILLFWRWSMNCPTNLYSFLLSFHFSLSFPSLLISFSRLQIKFYQYPSCVWSSSSVENVEGKIFPKKNPSAECVCLNWEKGADPLKMECSSKGELALAHWECAVKWFNIKGNRSCDVCNQKVQNLPVSGDMMCLYNRLLIWCIVGTHCL